MARPIKCPTPEAKDEAHRQVVRNNNEAKLAKQGKISKSALEVVVRQMAGSIGALLALAEARGEQIEAQGKQIESLHQKVDYLTGLGSAK